MKTYLMLTQRGNLMSTSSYITRQQDPGVDNSRQDVGNSHVAGFKVVIYGRSQHKIFKTQDNKQ